MNRLRVIAGPNGSGKSSIYQVIKEFKENGKVIRTGPFVNADVIDTSLRDNRSVYLADFGIDSINEELIDDYLKISTLKKPYNPELIKHALTIQGNCLLLKDAYSPFIGMILSDFIREELLKRELTFTMETVFSHPEKLRFMERAQEKSYRVYLYFVSTEDPDINIKRVEGRVAGGGHDVPTEKIVDRYFRTMNHLLEAVKISHRAYIFDNSGKETIKVAEKDTEGRLYLNEKIPKWVLTYLNLDFA